MNSVYSFWNVLVQISQYVCDLISKKIHYNTLTKKVNKETVISYSSHYTSYVTLQACINKSSEGTRVILVCDPLEVELG